MCPTEQSGLLTRGAGRGHGIQPSEFNLPDWEQTNADLHECLCSLFKATPSTALIVDEVAYFINIMQPWLDPARIAGVRSGALRKAALPLRIQTVW